MDLVLLGLVVFWFVLCAYYMLSLKYDILLCHLEYEIQRNVICKLAWTVVP